MKNTTELGHAAERVAAQYLEKQGYTIICTNWRTTRCEIDIVSTKDGCAYFIEVKYRRSGAQGLGLDYITSKKLQQMKFAAEIWVQQNGWSGEYSLGAIEVTGLDLRVSGSAIDLV